MELSGKLPSGISISGTLFHAELDQAVEEYRLDSTSQSSGQHHRARARENAWPDNREKNPKPSTTGFGTYGGEALLIKEAHQMNNGPTPETRASGETGLIEGRS